MRKSLRVEIEVSPTVSCQCTVEGGKKEEDWDGTLGYYRGKKRRRKVKKRGRRKGG